MATAWTQDLGGTQGRVQDPIGFAQDESYAMVAGSDRAGQLEWMEVGSYRSDIQVVDMTTMKLVRFRTRLVPPASMPAGVAWRFSLRVDGVEHAAQELVPGRARDRVDMAANVSSLVGTHQLELRVELVEV